MTDKELEIIKKRCDSAAKGPWISYVEGRDFWGGSSFIKTAESDIELIGATVADQDFIAHAREDVLILLNEVYRLRNKYMYQGSFLFNKCFIS